MKIVSDFIHLYFPCFQAQDQLAAETKAYQRARGPTACLIVRMGELAVTT